MAAEFVIYRKQQKEVKDVKGKILLKDPLVEKAFPRIGRLEVKIKDESCIGAGPTS